MSLESSDGTAFAALRFFNKRVIAIWKWDEKCCESPNAFLFDLFSAAPVFLGMSKRTKGWDGCLAKVETSVPYSAHFQELKKGWRA
ncbi:MAG: hypothetical protein AAFV25_12930 [Bacteroidota bacterium]